MLCRNSMPLFEDKTSMFGYQMFCVQMQVLLITIYVDLFEVA
jgi:hypothetical protein